MRIEVIAVKEQLIFLILLSIFKDYKTKEHALFNILKENWEIYINKRYYIRLFYYLNIHLSTYLFSIPPKFILALIRSPKKYKLN